MKYLLPLLASLLFTACATDSPLPTPTVEQSNPVVWKFIKSNNYEDKQPGLGISERFESAIGWIDVYDYDLKRQNWMPGTTDSAFSAHFKETIDVVQHFEKLGRYKNVVVIGPKDVVISNLPFRTASFTYSAEGKPVNSTTYLTARNGKLLKYRISIYENSVRKLSIDSVADSFIRENLSKQKTHN